MYAIRGAAGRYKSQTGRTLRMMRTTKLWPIAGLPANTLGRVVRQVKRLDTILRAPLSGRAYVMYRVTVAQTIQAARSRSTIRIVDDQVAVAFALVDDSGEAFDDPTDKKISLMWMPRILPASLIRTAR